MTDVDSSIEQEAARWAVRTSQGKMDAEQRAALDAWLAVDRRHHGALLRARAGLRVMDRALAEEQPRRIFVNDNEKLSLCVTPFRLTRAQVARRAVALAACLAAVLLIGVQNFTFLQTQPGFEAEHSMPNTLNLTDGSTVALGDGGKIEVAMSDQTRRIVLLSGEATFTVAKDRERPFVVQSGSVFAQATGTRYSVKRQGNLGAAVSVTEGSVLVWARDERDQAVLLRAGDKLALEPTLALLPQPSLQRELPPPAIAKISLDNVPISSAVARFNRVNSTQIVIADPEIGAIRIVGLFKANDPEHFAEVVAQFTDAKVMHEQGNIVIKIK